MTLTEQYKKGELPYGYYYIKTISGGEVIDRYYRDCTDYDLCEYGDVWENRFEDEILEVIAPVPSYEEWKELSKQRNRLIRDINGLAYIQEENQQLKELLKECRDDVYNYQYICLGTLTKIDNAIGEKK